MTDQHTERAAWARLTDTRRGKPSTLAVLPKVTRAYWDGRITSPTAPPHSEQRGDPETVARRRAAARAEAKAALEAQRAGLDRIDSFGESAGADLQAEDLAWVDAAGVAHDLPAAEAAPSALPAVQTKAQKHIGRPKVGERIDWDADDIGLGRLPPSEIAATMNVTRSHVLEIHRRKRIKPAPESEAYIAATKAARPSRVKIVSDNPTEEMRQARIGNTSKIAWTDQPMGVEMVADMAARLGVTIDSVVRAHNRMGIEHLTPRRVAARQKASERAAAKAQAAKDAQAKRDAVKKAEMRRARERSQPKAKKSRSTK